MQPPSDRGNAMNQTNGSYVVYAVPRQGSTQAGLNFASLSVPTGNPAHATMMYNTYQQQPPLFHAATTAINSSRTNSSTSNTGFQSSSTSPQLVGPQAIPPMYMSPLSPNTYNITTYNSNTRNTQATRVPASLPSSWNNTQVPVASQTPKQVQIPHQPLVLTGYPPGHALPMYTLPPLCAIQPAPITSFPAIPQDKYMAPVPVNEQLERLQAAATASLIRKRSEKATFNDEEHLRPTKRSNSRDQSPGTSRRSNGESTSSTSEVRRRRKGRKMKNTSSRYRGVSWNKRDKRWMARVWIDRKLHSVGNFLTEKKAALAFDDKMIELFSENDPNIVLNFPDKETREKVRQEVEHLR